MLKYIPYRISLNKVIIISNQANAYIIFYILLVFPLFSFTRISSFIHLNELHIANQDKKPLKLLENAYSIFSNYCILVEQRTLELVSKMKLLLVICLLMCIFGSVLG